MLTVKGIPLDQLAPVQFPKWAKRCVFRQIGHDVRLTRKRGATDCTVECRTCRLKGNAPYGEARVRRGDRRLTSQTTPKEKTSEASPTPPNSR